MRRTFKVAGWVLLVLLLLPVLAVGVVFAGLNTDVGRRLVEQRAGSLTGGTVELSGLGGRFPDALRLGHFALRDNDGVWLSADGVLLDWSPMRLLSRLVDVDTLSIERLQMPRLPVTAPTTEPPPAPASTEPFRLPVKVSARQLHVARAELGAPVAGAAGVFALEGKLDLQALDLARLPYASGTTRLDLRRLDGEGRYTLDATLEPQRVRASLDAAEPAGGFAATASHLPDLGALDLHAKIDGPMSALGTQLALAAGPLKADVHGTVDVDGQSAALDLTASAPAMAPRADISWQSIAVDAHVHGPWTKPDAAGTVRVAGLEASGSAVRLLSADLSGNAGHVGVLARVEGLRLAGPAPGLLADAPVVLKADAQLDDPARPVTFSVSHPLLGMDGTARTGGALAADVNLALPRLTPFAAVAGVEIDGRGQVKLHVAQGAGGALTFALDGGLGIDSGLVPLPGLIGPDATFAVRATLDGQDIAIQSAKVDGKAVHATLSGTDKAGLLDLRYSVGLTDLSVLAASVAGTMDAQGTVAGPPDRLAVTSDLAGSVAAAGQPRGPIKASVQVEGLPGTPTGSVEAEGTLLGAPLALTVDAVRGADGVLHAGIKRADWRSLHAAGALTLAPGAKLPTGQVSLRMTRLDDLRAFVGQALTGSVTADAVLDADTARLTLDARDAGVPGSKVGRAELRATVTHPLNDPVVDATLRADGLDAGGTTGAAQVTVRGPQSALAIKLGAQVTAGGEPVTADAAATLDVPAKRLELRSLQAVAHGQTARLLQPARIAFGGPVTVDRLRVGLQSAVLELAGRVSPTLDLTASVRGVDASLAKAFAPDLEAAGTVTAEARLTGTPAAPAGTVRLNAQGMRLLSGPARGLPPASLVATAQLAGRSARLDARLNAGPNADVQLSGTAPLGAGAMDLRATGSLDLRLLDPILTAAGRRAQGKVTLNMAATGPLAGPRLGGTLQLAGGEIQDFAQGFRIYALNGRVEAAGDTLRIVGMQGRAGQGTVAVSGTVGALRPGLPADLTITMRNARILASDQLTATLNGDLSLKGEVAGQLTAAGTVGIVEANIQVPDHLPASVVVLNVRRPGDKPPAAPSKSSSIDLNMTVTAQRVFVRGRGLDSELGGTLRVRGNSAAPQVSGGFDMRRGSISLAGTTLIFSRGKVGFDGTGVTGKIDPTLDFEADSTAASVTAMLLVGGYASAPKITLKSTPELPQDEVLAYLLFKRSAKDLGPFQIASIAAGLAELSGATGGASNPLDRVRRGLGLDRLAVGGGGSTGSSPTLEAGRYVANGVYVGAKQGTSGAGTQATVQIDIAKGLKLETDAGSGQGGNSVGLTYSFDY